MTWTTSAPGPAARLHFVRAEIGIRNYNRGRSWIATQERATMRRTVFLTVLLAVGLAFLVSAGSDAMVAPSVALRSAATSPAITETAALRRGGKVGTRRGAVRTRHAAVRHRGVAVKSGQAAAQQGDLAVKS